MTIPATVTITVDIDAGSKQEAIVAGYDHALAALPSMVEVVKLHTDAAMLDSCEPILTPAQQAADELPPSPHQQGSYTLQRFSGPESLAAAKPEVQMTMAHYDAAVKACEALGEARDDYMRRVIDKLGNVLHEKKNLFGRHVVVVFTDQAAFESRTYRPWEGWIADPKAAKKQALALLEAGKVYAVGVVRAATSETEETLIMTLSRSALS